MVCRTDGLILYNTYIIIIHLHRFPNLGEELPSYITNYLHSMHQVIFRESEWRTDQERRAKYLGTAKVKINQIVLPLEYDQDKVQGLRDLFYRQGCDRLSPRNHVVAVISKENLLATCYNSHINIEALINNRSDSYDQLDFTIGQLECLQGQHRLRAGKEYLGPSDQWWTVDLYADGKFAGVGISSNEC